MHRRVTTQPQFPPQSSGVLSLSDALSPVVLQQGDIEFITLTSLNFPAFVLYTHHFLSSLQSPRYLLPSVNVIPRSVAQQLYAVTSGLFSAGPVQ
ncbi:predicted protein [Plenodomus lingam JN3]|uniref:Predicted protein n=1 Tax=Leptosphaeria maculans (strain JN3 / isolate v23.1.3 / race Av1-4-5-6-7-8) TaxID=985895 RepID=E5A019_LEPMJ|nr:predicted protein [Plenodomus lingam JN3]CBX96879.1 predicted protein [Plenodomus lingam JN3]